MSVTPVSRVRQTAGSDLDLWDGNLIVRELSISPLTVEPQGTITVSGWVGMNEDAAWRPRRTWDFDGCNCESRGLDTLCEGIGYRTILETEWGDDRELQSGCTEPDRVHPFDVQVQAPAETGTYDVAVALKTSNTNQTDRNQGVLEVTTDGGGDDGGCDSDWHCPTGEVCLSGTCQPRSDGCTYDWDCLGDEVCVDGTCQPPSNGGGNGGNGGNGGSEPPQTGDDGLLSPRNIALGGLAGAGILIYLATQKDDPPQRRGGRNRPRRSQQ